MAAATITSKGQVTIPVEVREKLGLRAGDRIEFLLQKDGTFKVIPTSARTGAVFGMLKGHVRKGAVTVEEMDRKLSTAFRGGKRP
jgi:AbrB family looped-hinge helix DNA binding protein